MPESWRIVVHKVKRCHMPQKYTIIVFCIFQGCSDRISIFLYLALNKWPQDTQHTAYCYIRRDIKRLTPVQLTHNTFMTSTFEPPPVTVYLHALKADLINIFTLAIIQMTTWNVKGVTCGDGELSPSSVSASALRDVIVLVWRTAAYRELQKQPCA